MSLFPCNSDAASGHTHFRVGILSLKNEGIVPSGIIYFLIMQLNLLGPMDLIDKSYSCWAQGSVMDPRNFQMILGLYIFFYFKFLINVNKISNIQVLSEISETDETFFISTELISAYKRL